MPNVMAVHPSVPANTVAEFIAYAKANPGKVNFASGGVGTSVHVSGELFKQMTGVQMQHVAYRGAGPATIDLLAGQVQVMFDNLNSQIDHIKQGKLRALGVTIGRRVPRRCRMCRRSPRPCRASRRAHSSASARRAIFRPTCCASSTARSTPACAIPS